MDAEHGIGEERVALGGHAADGRLAAPRYLPPQHALPGVARGGAELLLDADELVVFGEAVGARQRCPS